jgi:hypothetical protein
MATLDLQASTLFGASATYFNPQSSSSTHTDEAAMIKDALGNMECETTGLDGKTEYENEYAYCNASPDIKTDLAALLTAFGDVVNSIKVTELSIRYTAGQYATVSIKGHQHDEQAHASGYTQGTANVAAAVPANSGFGVPTFTGVTLGSGASPIEATLTFSFEHKDVVGADGNHFAGKNITPKATLSITYEGTPSTGQPVTGWTTDTYSAAPKDSNDDFDKYEYTGHRYFDLATS